MKYLCLNNINNLDLKYLYIKETRNNYKIYFNKNNIILSGIFFHCDLEIEKNNNSIKIIINENNNLFNIDNLLSKKIINYKSFIMKDDNNKYYIKFNNSELINKIYNNIYKNYYLYIKYINKYTKTPVIHILS